MATKAVPGLSCRYNSRVGSVNKAVGVLLGQSKNRSVGAVNKAVGGAPRWLVGTVNYRWRVIHWLVGAVNLVAEKWLALDKSRTNIRKNTPCLDLT